MINCDWWSIKWDRKFSFMIIQYTHCWSFLPDPPPNPWVCYLCVCETNTLPSLQQSQSYHMSKGKLREILWSHSRFDLVG